MDNKIKTLAELEKEYIQFAIEVLGNNKTAIANALGISLKTLYNKLHQYGMDEIVRKKGDK